VADAKVLRFPERPEEGPRRAAGRIPRPADGADAGDAADAADAFGAADAADSAGAKGRVGQGGSADRAEPAGQRDGQAEGSPEEAAAETLRELLASLGRGLRAAARDQRVAHGLDFLRRRLTGGYQVDEFGFDAELTEQVLLTLIRPLYEQYFRVEVQGLENVPSEGGALIVANHSGVLPIDALMVQVALHDHHPARRELRLLAADLVFRLPVLGGLARKAGHTLACAEDAQRLLERGEVVGVMPEGFKGLGKPFGERYRLQRFGRGGFVSTALRTASPIVPCAIVGAEEIYPKIGDARTVARVLGLPYFPITPTFPLLGPLGAVPLPTKWTIRFGEPMETDGYSGEAVDDPMLLFNVTDQVRETIQHMLYRMLLERRSVFF
jgi:1-acyl-sn-glycerol-3-phosphate acyltransferase